MANFDQVAWTKVGGADGYTPSGLLHRSDAQGNTACGRRLPARNVVKPRLSFAPTHPDACKACARDAA